MVTKARLGDCIDHDVEKSGKGKEGTAKEACGERDRSGNELVNSDDTNWKHLSTQISETRKQC